MGDPVMKNMFMFVLLTAGFHAYAENSIDSSAGYVWMTQLSGEWILSPTEQQEGKSTQHKLVKPLIGTNQVAMNFKTIGKGSTVQEDLLPGNKKQMVTMYHCGDADCSQLLATHYCVKQNQPQLLAKLEDSSPQKWTFDCNMNTELCNSDENHVRRITHELSNNGEHLRTTYVSWNKKKYLKTSVYHFDRR